VVQWQCQEHVTDVGTFINTGLLTVLLFIFDQIDLPDFDKLRREANLAPDEMRAEMKRLGILPARTFQERDIIISSTSMELLISLLWLLQLFIFWLF